MNPTEQTQHPIFNTIDGALQKLDAVLAGLTLTRAEHTTVHQAMITFAQGLSEPLKSLAGEVSSLSSENNQLKARLEVITNERAASEMVTEALEARPARRS